MKKPKSYTCPECGNQFFKRNSLQRTCFTPKCAIYYVRKKQEAKAKKENDKLFKALKHKVVEMDLEVIKKRMERYINKIVRLLDKGHQCMSSGKPYGTYTVHAGHFINVGADESLRFNLLNIWAQADFDNTHGGGNKTYYRINLIKTFGQELMDEIDGLKAKYPYVGFNVVDLGISLTVARKIALRLEKEDKIYSIKERVELRKLFNQEINIYK